MAERAVKASATREAPRNRGATVAVSRGTSDPRWDEFLLEVPGGDHVQSSMWARLKATVGWESVRLVSRHGDLIVGGAQVLIRAVPLLGRVAYVPRGPISARADPGLMDELVRQLLEVSHRAGAHVLVVQPPSGGEAWEPRLRRCGFRPEHARLMPTATTIVDLGDDLDTIFGRVKRKVRYNVRYGLRNGISVREGDEGDLPTFHRLLSKTAERQGFSPEPFDYYSELWRLFRAQNQVSLHLAECDGEAICAELGISFAGTLVSKRIGWSGTHKTLNPNDVLRWEVIRWAKSTGHRRYDLEGIDPRVADAVLRGEPVADEFKESPTSFKLRFGGEVVRLPGALSYVSNPVLRWGYRTMGAWMLESPRLQSSIRRLGGRA